MKEETTTYDELAQKVAHLEQQLQQQQHLDLFFQHSSDGYFFMMLDEPVFWNAETDKKATLDYIFAHQKITRFNDAMLKQNGMVASQYEGITPNDIYKDNMALGYKLWAEFLNRGEWELEQEIQALETKNTLIVQCYYKAIYDEQGRFCGHFGRHRDITNEKLYLQELEEAQDFSEAILNSLDANICVLDKQGKIITTNEAWKKFSLENGGVVEKTNEESNYLHVCSNVDKKNTKEIQDKRAATHAIQGIEDILRGEIDHFILEYPCHSPTEERWFLMRANALRGSKRGAVISHINVTPLKQAYKKLEVQKASLLLQESIITHLNDAIIVTEAEPFDKPRPRILFVNPAFTRMTGHSSDEVIGNNPRILQGPKTDRKILDKIRKALKNWQPIEVELINYKKNGEEFWVNFSIVPLSDETGWYTHWVSVQKDITERKRQEELLKESEEKYRTLFEESPIGVVVFEPPSRKAIEYNEQAAQMLGYTQEEFGKLDPLDYIVNTPDEGDRRFDVPQNQPMSCEQETKKKDGSLGNMLVTVKRLFLQEKELLLSMRLDITARRHFEKQLKSFFDVSNDLIAIANFEGYFLQLNKAWTRVLGYSLEELKSKPWIEWIHPDDKEATLEEVAKGFGGDKTEFFVNRYKHKNGQDVWLEWTAVHDTVEEITYASARDITLELSAKQKLTNNEAKYRALFEESPEGIVLLDSDTWKPTEFNQQVLVMLGYATEEFEQIPLDQHLVDYGFDKINEVAELIRTEGAIDMEVRMYDKQQQIKTISAKIKTIQIADKEVFFNIWADITEKKHTEEKIRIGEERFRGAIDSSLDAIYILEAFYGNTGEVIDFTFEDMNLVGRKQLDFLGFEVLGERLCEIHPVNREQGYFDRYKKVFLTGETFDGEFPIYVEGYAPQWLHQTVVKIDDGVVLIARDVTLRRTASDSIRASEERFRSAIDSSLDAFYILDAFYDDKGEVVDFTFVDMNTIGLQSINLPKEEIFGEKLCEVLPVNREKGFFEKYKTVFLTGKTLDEEVLLTTERLKFSWIHHTIVKLKDGVAITTRDITYRKQYEAKLKELNEDLQSRNQKLSVQEEHLSQANEELLAQQEQLKFLLAEITNNEQKFRSLAENIKDVFWIRKNDKIEYASPAYEQIWQQSVNELYENDQSFAKALPPEDKERLMKVMKGEEYRKTGLLDVEYRVVRPDKTIRWVQARTFPVEVNKDTFHVVGIGTDVTEAKKAEVRLQELNVALALKNQELQVHEEELRLTNEELKANKETLEEALERLSVSESNLKALFDSSGQSIILLDTTFNVIAFNRAVHSFHNDSFLSNFKEKANILDCYQDNVHLAQAYRDKFEKCLQGEIIVFERQLNYPDFMNIRWVETTLLPVKDSFDVIIGLSFNEKDITDQRNIESKLRKSEVRLRALMNNTVQSFFLMDKNMRLLLFNTSADNYTKQAFGKKLKLGENFLDFAPEPLHQPFKEKFKKALKGEMVTNEREVVYKDGTTAWFEVTYAAIKDVRGESDMVIFSTLDITQRKMAQEREKRLLQEQIAYQLEQERFKRAAILEGQERESHRISRELHDGVGQMLSALSYQINHLETSLEEAQNGFASETYRQRIKPTAERAKEMLKEVIQEIREISHNLMPKILVDYGLIEALKQLRLDFLAGVNMPINLDIFCERVRFEDNIEISIFRIAQEAINNILKYAQATEINIQLIEHETNLQLLVEDNGKGFELEKVKHQNTNGLINMEERTRLVNGHFSIDTELGKGTCIMVEIPLKPNNDNV